MDRPVAWYARLVAGYGAIACALPYLGLKLIWIGGGTLGVADQKTMAEGGTIALNVVTAGMDLVGIGLALAFTHRWGLRIPAWLLLPPMWVATGLLATFVLWVPLSAVVSLLTPSFAPRVSGGLVEPWIYVLVYVDFAGLGIGLLAAFVLYSRTRWPEAFRSQPDASGGGATHELQVPLANALAPLAAGLGFLHLAWAVGVPIGLTGDAARRWTVPGSLFNGVHGVIMTTAAVGVWMMVHRTGRDTHFWLPMSMTWVGAGSLFGWGLWPLLNVLAQSALVRDSSGMAFLNLTHLLSVLVGLAMGLLLLVVLTERHGTTVK